MLGSLLARRIGESGMRRIFEDVGVKVCGYLGVGAGLEKGVFFSINLFI